MRKSVAVIESKSKLKGFFKKLSWWKKIVLFVLVIVAMIGVAFHVWFAYLESFYVLSKIPSEIEYYGVVEGSGQDKLLVGGVICGHCFGLGERYETKIIKTGECCYKPIYGPDLDYYQIVKINATIERLIEKRELLSRVRFSIKDIIIIEDLKPEDCEKRNYVEYCYDELARKLNDPRLCNKIWDESLKNYCINEVSARSEL